MSILNWSNHSSVPHYLRDEEHPESLPLILRLEKDPTMQPTHEEALLATSKAIVELFNDPRASSSDEWLPYLESWMSGRIRKVSRRARGSAWDKVQELEGITVTFGNAEVRVLLPHPLDKPPLEIKKLQVAGLDLPRDPNYDFNSPSKGLFTSINPDIKMTTGKSMAQIGHATQLAIFNSTEEEVRSWDDKGQEVHLGEWLSPVRWQAEIQDAGFTEVAPGTVTARGRIS